MHKFMGLFTGWMRAAGILVAALFLAALQASAHADVGADLFSALLGSWRGSGQYELADGSVDRLKCNAYYTGGGAQLGMAIRCSSDTNKIEIRSKLSRSSDRITGRWEERTYNAEGSAVGQAAKDKVTLRISGSISGTMSVQYGRSQHVVTITVQDLPFKSVNIALTRS